MRGPIAASELVKGMRTGPRACHGPTFVSVVRLLSVTHIVSCAN